MYNICIYDSKIHIPSNTTFIIIYFKLPWNSSSHKCFFWLYLQVTFKHSCYAGNQTSGMHLMDGETFWTKKAQVISLCKHQCNCLKGWQDLNITGVFLANHAFFYIKTKEGGCAVVHDSIFLKRTATFRFWNEFSNFRLKFQFYCLKKKAHNEQINNRIQNSWHKARDLSIFQVDLSKLGKEQ